MRKIITPPAPRPPKKSTSIVPTGFACTSSNDRVRKIFVELRSLKLSQHPNSTAIMLRVLIDIALWDFVEKSGLSASVINHYDKDKKKRKYDANWMPPLRNLISYLVENQKFPGMSAAGYKATRTLISKDNDQIITIEGFNAFTHNPHMTPMESELQALWTRAQPMLEIILSRL